MVSNDVEALGVGDACEALLLTAKARVIAPLVVVRRGADDFLLLTEPGLAETVRRALVRTALRREVLDRGRGARVQARRRSRAAAGGIANLEYGIAAYELVDEETPAWSEITDEELELLRIRAGSPRFGHEIDDRILPAEAGLEARAIDFEKGCYPGQEPIARQHYRGRVNRTLRVLELDGDELPDADGELSLDGKVVGRVTSAAREDGQVLALGYVRTEVPRDAELDLAGRRVRPA